MGITPSQEGHVGRILLDAPERRNALTPAMCDDLTGTLERFEAEGQVRVVVLTGAGPVFCAGASFDALPEDGDKNPFGAVAERVSLSPLPVIGALNGGAYGAGVDLALACDIRIGVEGMKVKVPAANLGVHYPATGLRRSLAELGPQITRRLFLLGETLSGESLVTTGILDRVVPAAALMEEANTVARSIATAAPLAVQGMKRTLAELQRGITNEEVWAGRENGCFRSQDHREAKQAMAEKRPPRFQGR